MIGLPLSHQGNRAEIVRVLGTWQGRSSPHHSELHYNGLLVNLYVFATETIERHIRVIQTPAGLRVERSSNAKD